MKKLIAGNWKMNLTSSEVDNLTSAMSSDLPKDVDVLICPPAVYLERVLKAASGSGLFVGGQDCSHEESGAHTGDIGAKMLKDVGCSYVILGHSERRQGQGEVNALVKMKAEVALNMGIKVIICVGETLRQREDGVAFDVVAQQLKESWPRSGMPETVVIAYEPVWAIGTGKTASPDDVEDMHDFIRLTLEKMPGAPINTRILYGGSVKPENAGALLAIDNVDGALVGGASLKADQFLSIVQEAVA